MANPKVTAEDVIRALRKDPQLLADVRAKLGAELPPVAWGLTMVEHEFGQRDEGWSIFPTKEAALAYQKEHEGGIPEQYWTYDGPTVVRISHPVAELLIKEGRLSGKSRRLPRDEVITMGHLSVFGGG
jgi:hypothetical protein